ncbi:MAG: pirin family protein [Chitinophagaceae bacterium]
MKTVLHPSADRGHVNHGWLNAKHSFSFASWYNPEKVHFGALRVLNDDWVAPGMGFGMHPHDNMEIITIPFSGTLAHKDSMGNNGTISYGEIQVMSAGLGIMHSEFNHSASEPVTLFQIWLFPKVRDVKPRYDQIAYDKEKMHNEWLQIISPDPNDAGSWIHQDAWFHLGRFEKGMPIEYRGRKEGNGFYVMMIEGDMQVEGQVLHARDAMGITEADGFKAVAESDCFLLVMDIPMHVK